MTIKLIVGLGNPGDKYHGTRHNAGADFARALASRENVSLKSESKFLGESGRWQSGRTDLRLLVPNTYMNRSGNAVAAIASFYKIEPGEILVAHDELDFDPGVVRIKDGGGHGGHNGLRDIHRVIGPDYRRLRIGIGHPGNARDVSNYVLKQPSAQDRKLIARHALGRRSIDQDLPAGRDVETADHVHEGRLA